MPTKSEIPWRMRGWSSTARIRIDLGSALMTSTLSLAHRSVSHPSLSGKLLSQPRTAASSRGVSSGGRNTQFNLCTGIALTPDRHLPPHKFGAFAHAVQAIVSFAPFSSKNLRINTLSIIPDTESELLLVIPDFDFYPPRLCVPEGVAQRLAR